MELFRRVSFVYVCLGGGLAASQPPLVAAPGSRRDWAKCLGWVVPRGSDRCEWTEAQRVLGQLKREETQVAISKTQHRVPDITTELARGRTVPRMASFSTRVVLSLTIAAQSPEWWCRWPQRLNASSVPIITANLQHLLVTDGAAIIHLSSPVLLLLWLQLDIHLMWPKKRSSTPGTWPLCQRG